MSILLQAINQSLDERINQQFSNLTSWFIDGIFAEIPLTETTGIPWVLIVLLLGAGYFTIYFKFVNFHDQDFCCSY